MSATALQVATIVNGHDAKLATWDEVINGGETSIGAQLRRLMVQKTVFLRRPSGLGVAPRNMAYHCVAFSADFPAAAMGLASKGSTAAHRYDRKSTIDQTTEAYAERASFSLLNPEKGGFQRITYAMFFKFLTNAASIESKTDREAYLSSCGLNAGNTPLYTIPPPPTNCVTCVFAAFTRCVFATRMLLVDSFEFDKNGGYKCNFALARIPNLDWLHGNTHDCMHTSLLGPGGLEVGLMQYMFICNRKYYSRDELNEAVRRRYEWPRGALVPEFGKYIEEGATGGVPSSTGKVHYTASQVRHWLEHGTIIMEGLFERKVRAQLRARNARAMRVLCACYARATRSECLPP